MILFPEFGAAIEGARKVFGKMDDTNHIIPSTKNLKNKISGNIEFKDVYFKYPGALDYTFRGISFKIAQN